MLNYTSKIQHFLNLHRKHTKYIVVLLLLSAFVASFVCSALTEPAVSMTDPIQMGQNVTLLADGDQSDGLPIISGHYENSQFKDYIKWDTQTSTDGRLLGSAHNFALFAFEEINIKTPCYGNLASKKLNVNANFGLENIASAGGQSITIATESFLHGGGAQSKNTVLLVPQNVNFYNEQGNPVTINPIPKVQIKQPDGTTGHFEKGTIDVYAYHVTSDFIDFTAEKNNFITLQKWLVEQGGKNENSIINLGDTNIIRDPTNNDQFREIKIDNKGVNYLNIDYKNLPTDSKVLNLYLAEDAAVIINVDCKDVTENIKTSFQFREYQNGDEIGNNSEAYLKGTNVLWNFYNSNDTNYQFDKEIHMGNSASGIILAPSSNVYLNSQHTGGVVANKIETSATFTKAMFMTSMESFASGSIAVMAKKNWQNNEIPDGASVQVELYRSKTPNVDITNLPDGEKVGDTLTLNAGNYWNATWFDLDQSYYYYVKELPVSANGKFYEAAYTNNGRNTTGTVDIENSIMEIESGGDNEGGETETPTQTIDITVEIKTNPENLFYNPNEETNGKNINLYRTTTPNLTVDKLPTGDNIDPETGKIKDADRYKFPSDMELVISDLPEYDNDQKQKSYFIRQKDNWQHTFEDQPMFDSNKNPYYYYIIETWHQTNSAVGYENVYLGNGAYLKDSTITMYSIKTIDINVVKNWQNTNDSNPNSVKFEIWRSYTSQQSIPSDAQWVSTNELSSSNSWSAKVENVPISDINNNTYYYYIKETEIENNSSKLNEYDISYSTNDNVYPIYSDKANDANDRHSITESNITITNKKKAADKISITVKKDMRGKDNDYWNNQTFKFTLYRDTKSNDIWGWVQEYELTKSNNWEITISDLDKYNNNQPYYYKVVETNTPTTFNATYSTEALNAGSVSGNGTIWIYNNPKKVSLNIKKFWENINDDIIDYVKIKVYQVKSTDYQMAQTLLLNNSLTFNSYINMLNDSSTPTINGNTATYTGLSFAPVTASDYNHEIRVDLSQFAGNALSTVSISFSSDVQFTAANNNVNHLLKSNNASQGLWNPSDLVNMNFYVPIQDQTHLIITSVENVDYYISSLELTFQNEITTGGTTPSEPEQDDNTNNTVVLTNPVYDTNKQYSNHQYNFVFDLSQYKNRKVTKIEYKFNQNVTFTNRNGDTGACQYFFLYALRSQLPGSYKILRTEDDFANAKQQCSYNSSNYVLTLNESFTVEENDLLVFTSNSAPNFQIQQLTLTFADSGGNVIHESDTFTATPSTDYTYKIVEKFSAYSGRLVTEIKSYYYSKANDAHDYQSGYNLYAGNDVNGYMPSDSSKSNWNEYIQTQGYNNENLTQVTFNAKYPDNLQKIIVTYSDGSTFTLNNTAWNNKIHYSDSIQFNSASGNGTNKMSGSDNAYNILSKFSSYNEKTVKSIYTYFYGLDSNGKNNSTLHDHTFNTWARGNINGETGGYIDDSSPNNNWNGDARVKEYTEENGKNITGFSVQTRYANNVEKVVVNYTDGSTFILYNSNYNGQLDTIVIPTGSTADHDSRDWGFNTGYASQHIWIENSNFRSKEVDYVEMYFNNQITQFPDWKVYDIWLGDYNNPIGTRSQDSYYQKDSYWVAKWNYTNATSVSQIGARTVNYTDVQKLVITYTDQSTYTINNSNAQSSTSDYVTYEYYFENNNQLTMTPTSYHTLYIPENFKDKPVQKIEAHFANLQTFDLSNFDSEILNMWVKGKDGYDFWSNSYEEKTSDGNVLTKGYSKAEQQYRQNISEIVIVPTKYTQNLEKIVVTFDNGSITINNKSYNSSAFEVGSGTQNTTAAPQQTTVTYTTTISVPNASFITDTNATNYGYMDGNVKYEFNIAGIDNEIFATKTVKEVKATVHNWASLKRTGGTYDYYNTVFDMYLLDESWNVINENWDQGETSDKGDLSQEDYIIKRYYNVSGRKIKQLNICTAYTQNLEQIVITFTDGSTITISNSGYNANNLATSPTPLPSTTTTPSDGFITEITLTETNNWSATLNDLPMVAPDGTPYYYIIVEVEIKYTDGTVLSGIDNITKKFDVTKNKEYLELSDKDGAENLLSITNSLKLTNVNMPSTGGIGTHPYRNAGILMMICSGGIYISLRALRKKQN